MKRSDAILVAVGFAAQCLREGNWNAHVAATLERMGRATDVDRIYVFENHVSPEGVPLTSQRFEWVRQGITAQIDNPSLQNLAWSDTGVEDWMVTLAAGRPVVALTRDLSEPAYSILRKMQGILSIVLVPIFNGNDPWGYLGFDDCTHERQWDEAELSALKAGANIFGAALERKKLQEALEEIKTLRGILPICAHCKKIRDENGCWNQIETYIHTHSGVEFSHGLCPECARKFYPDYCNDKTGGRSKVEG